MTIFGDVKFLSRAIFSVQLDGIFPATQYDQLRVNGTVDLTGSMDNPTDSILIERLTFAPPLGTSWRIIDNDGVEPILTRFDQQVEGAFYPLDTTLVNISYNAGDAKNDVVIGHEGRFQFDATPAQTQPYYQSLPVDPFTGFGPVKSAANEAGWDQPVRIVGRGGSEGSGLPGGPYTPVSLLRSLAFTGGAATFQVDALATDTMTGQPLTYQVLITSGDYGFDHNGSRFTVGDARVPVQQEVTASTAQSEFAQRVLQNVTVQEIVPGSNTGQVQVRMSYSGQLSGWTAVRASRSSATPAARSTSRFGGRRARAMQPEILLAKAPRQSPPGRLGAGRTARSVKSTAWPRRAASTSIIRVRPRPAGTWASYLTRRIRPRPASAGPYPSGPSIAAQAATRSAATCRPRARPRRCSRWKPRLATRINW